MTDAPTAVPPPELLSRGTAWSIYKTPSGGLHIAYLVDGEDGERHLPIPAALVRMAEAAATGAGPLGRLKALTGLGRGFQGLEAAAEAAAGEDPGADLP
jgi:hypothetical protein